MSKPNGESNEREVMAGLLVRPIPVPPTMFSTSEYNATHNVRELRAVSRGGGRITSHIYANHEARVLAARGWHIWATIVPKKKRRRHRGREADRRG